MVAQRSSSIPVVTDRLEELFASALATFGRDGSAVAVQQGDRWKNYPQEGVSIGAVSTQNAPAVFGGTRDETYSVDVTVIISDAGDFTFSDAKQRAFDVLAVLEEIVTDTEDEPMRAWIGFTDDDFKLMDVNLGALVANGPDDAGPTEASYVYIIHQAFDVHAIF